MTAPVVTIRDDAPDRVEIMLPCCWTTRVVSIDEAQRLASTPEAAAGFLATHALGCPSRKANR